MSGDDFLRLRVKWILCGVRRMGICRGFLSQRSIGPLECPT